MSVKALNVKEASILAALAFKANPGAHQRWKKLLGPYATQVAHYLTTGKADSPAVKKTGDAMAAWAKAYASPYEPPQQPSRPPARPPAF